MERDSARDLLVCPSKKDYCVPVAVATEVAPVGLQESQDVHTV